MKLIRDLFRHRHRFGKWKSGDVTDFREGWFMSQPATYATYHYSRECECGHVDVRSKTALV